MFAYVHVRTLNEYKTIRTSKIINFEHDGVGHQPAAISKKVFQFSLKKKIYNCQILIVGGRSLGYLLLFIQVHLHETFICIIVLQKLKKK